MQRSTRFIGGVSFRRGAPRALRSESHLKIVWELFGRIKHFRSNTLLMCTRPDLPRGRVDSIDGVRDVGDPTSNQHDSKSSNRYTTALLVINQAQLDWPRREGFSCKRIEEHKQEDVNTQSDIANMDEANHKRGSRTRFQRIDTVEEIKNGGPGSL